MSTQTEQQTPTQTNTSEGEKNPNGEKKLSAKWPRGSLAKKLDLLFEDRDSTKSENEASTDVENNAANKGNSSGGGRKEKNPPESPQKPIQNRFIGSLKISSSNVYIWHDFYGSLGVLMMLLLGNASVWKTQMEVLRSLAQIGRPQDDPGGDPYDEPVGDGDDKRRRGSDDLGLGPPDPFWSGDDDFLYQAAREFKDIVQAESNRVSVAVSPCPLHTGSFKLTSTRVQ